MLTNDDAHYVGTVLRARSGQMIETFDGAGKIVDWEIVSVAKHETELRNLEIGKEVGRRAPVNLTLGLNPLKGGTEEIAIRMAAAMEVASIIPVIFKRSDIPFDAEKLESRLERWRKLCISETAQSGGAWLPGIGDPVMFEDFAIPDGRVILLDEDSHPGTTVEKFNPGDFVTVLTGPEGGLERDEVDSATGKGIEIASLGPWTLRSELAASIVPSWVYCRV